MTANPLIDHIQTGNATYDLVSREVKNNNAASAQTNLKIWSGTYAQYSTITNRDAATVYNFTDVSPNQLSYISNCITEIPQDVNMEIKSNGRLVVKAGTKYYTPDGLSYALSSDQNRVISNNNVFVVLLLNKTDSSFNQLFEIDNNKVCSGSTDSLAGTSRHLWYDTTENKIKYFGNDGTTNLYYAAFPFGLASGNGSIATSVDQVFNGAGYIGHHAFVLPGVKGLIPDGINTDGTLKSKNITTAGLLILELPTYNTNERKIQINESGYISQQMYKPDVDTFNEIVQENWYIQYVKSDNLYYQYVSDVLYTRNFVPFVSFETQGSTITQFDVRQPVRLATQEQVDDLQTQIDGKQNTLTFDTTPTNSSTNPVTSGGVYTALSGKADTDLNNVSAGIDFVVETYHNGTDWYRLYKSGWIVQGGVTPQGNNATVTLHKEFADTNYSIQVSRTMLTTSSSDTGGRGYAPEVSNMTTKTFRVNQQNGSNMFTSWEAKGYMATE